MICNQRIKSKEDFLQFMEEFVALSYKGDFENKTLPEYLEAMSRWIEDMEGYYQNTNQAIPQNINWKVFSDILIASSMYE